MATARRSASTPSPRLASPSARRVGRRRVGAGSALGLALLVGRPRGARCAEDDGAEGEAEKRLSAKLAATRAARGGALAEGAAQAAPNVSPVEFGSGIVGAAWVVGFLGAGLALGLGGGGGEGQDGEAP